LGENNPQYKHGRLAGAKGNREIYNKAMREYYKLSPERKALRLMAMSREYQKEWAKTSKRKASKKAYQQTPKRKAANNRRSAAYRARKRAERRGEGTLDAFLK
tara:strand:+ start:3308 stop:3616 length:309 start_codon:yes stop_codon:yes gene_type:complete